MKHVKTKIISLFLSFIFLIGITPSYAAETYSGSYDNVSWRYVDGIVTLSGSGITDGLYGSIRSVDRYLAEDVTEIYLYSGIKTISKNSLMNFPSLKKVYATGVSVVEEYGFYGCNNLSEVVFSPYLKTLGNYAFSYNTAMTELSLPESLTTIGNNVFNNCTALRKVYVPEFVESIGTAFSCRSLQEIYYGGTHEQWAALTENSNIGANVTVYYEDDTIAKGTCDGISWTLKKSGELVVSGSGAMSKVEYMWASYYDYITSIKIEEGITGICPAAFQGCENITSVYIPDGVTNIDYMAFDGCKNIKNISLPATLTHIGTSFTSSVGTEIYFRGTQTQWENITVDSYNEKLETAVVYFNTLKVLVPNISVREVYGGKIAEILTSEPGAVIRYTTDGGEPTENSPVYRESLKFMSEGETTIKASVFVDGYETSDVVSETVSVLRAVAPTASVKDGAKFQWSYVTLSTTETDAEIYYELVTDDSVSEGAKYTKEITCIAPCVLSAVTRKKGYVDSETAVYNYLLPDPYVVTYNYSHNGGTSASAESLPVEIGNYADLTPTAEKEGYNFIGWNTNPDATTALTSFAPAENTTLYAIFSKEITASFYTYGNVLLSTETVLLYNDDKTATVTMPEIPKQKYGNAWMTAFGWRTDTMANYGEYYEGGTAEISEDTQFYANYAKPVELVFYGVKTYRRYVMISASGNTYTTTFDIIDHEEKFGYTFMGWSSNADSDICEYSAGDTVSISDSMTLYPIWKADTYIIKYNANKGQNAPASQTKTHDVPLVITSEKPTREGYDFLGWSKASGATVPAYMSGDEFTTNTNATLYAVWTIKTYNVSYDANGGENAPSAQTKIHGETLVLSNTIPTKEGYNFLGWSEDANAETADYTAGAEFAVNADTTLYAVWVLKTYNIRFNANGGENAPSAQTKIHGETLVLSNAIPTKEGHNFLGWSEKSNTETVDYISGGKFITNADTTLYAVWQRILDMPEFSAMDIIGGKQVAITAEAGADIYYTVNGDIPDILYNGEIILQKNATVKAKAVKPGFGDSDILVVEVEIEMLGEIYADVVDGTAVKRGTPVTLSHDVTDAVIYYTTNGSTPTEESMKYTDPIVINENMTVQAIAVCKGYANSNIFEANYSIAKTAVPVISVADVIGGKQVTITAENGAIIYYTINGEIPDENSPVYSGSIKINVPNTYIITATAYLDGYVMSDATKPVECVIKRAEKPESSIASGETVLIGDAIYLESPTEDAFIYYTTNGKNPTTSSTPYFSEIYIEDDITIKAISTKRGMANSLPATFKYTVAKADTPSLDYTGSGTVAIGTVIKVKSSNDAVVYYTTDGTVPTEESNVYSDGIVIDSDCTVKLFATEEGKKNSDVVSYDFKIQKTATPQITVTDVMGGKTAEITAENGTIIYYTLDGTVPDESSSVYENILEFTSEQSITVAAIAVKTGCLASEAVSAEISVEKAEIPVISIEEQVVVEGTICELVSEEYDIYYTLDGSDPRDYGVLFAESIVLNESVAISVVAVKTGYAYSDVVTKNITVIKKPELMLEYRETDGNLTVCAKIKGNSGISSAFLKLKYPANMLTATDVMQGDVFESGSFNIHESDNGLNVLWVNTDDVIKDGVLFETVLKKNTLVNTEIALEYVMGDIINQNFEDMYFDASNAKISIFEGAAFKLEELSNNLSENTDGISGSVTLNVLNNTGSEKKTKLIAAVYLDDVLVSCNITDFTAGVGENVYEQEVSADFRNVLLASEVKFMLWDSGTMIPLCTALCVNP